MIRFQVVRAARASRDATISGMHQRNPPRGTTTIHKRHSFLFVLISALALATAASAHKRQAASAGSGRFSLARVMGSPFPSELTVSAHGQTVAWVFNLRGVRNVWVATGPKFHAHAATHYTADNGQDISSLRLTPDGRTVVYVHGNERNDQGQVADPSSSVQPPQQSVYAASVRGGEPRLLGLMDCGQEDCEDIRISPSGKFAAWAGRGKIWIAPISGAEPARPLTYDRGRDVEPRWSPSGREIAFVSRRGDHSFIALYDFGRGRLSFMAPRFDRDLLPRWSPDGKQLAFIRTPGKRLQPPLVPVHYTPWKVMVADPQTGTARVVWRSGPAPQSSFGEDAETTAFRFAADDRIVFASQRDGWNHLYVVSARGGRARLLTPGRFAINTQLDLHNVFLTPGRRAIVYASNQGDIDRSHLWRVSLAGGPPVQITSGKTIECSPVVTAKGGHVVFLSSSGRWPLMPYLLEPGGERKELGKALFPRDFPASRLIEPREVVFHSLDGTILHGHLFVPPGRKKRHPAILYLHGGPMRQMLLGFNPQRYYHYFYAADEYLAGQGYVVFSLNYRMGTMYGWAFRHPAHAGWRGASEYQDVVAAGRYLAALPYVDPHRIGIWGGSYGGYLTGMGLARNSDLFAAGVDLEGMSNRAFTSLPNRPASDRAAAEKLAFRNSPDNYLSTWRSPVLLIQGDDDRNVAFSQNVDLADRLRAHHIPFQVLVFPNEVHMFLRWRTWMRAFEASVAFFNAHLRDAMPNRSR
jgi:dipeptidyl aminopeptidase/acylaminoacyl peptidase